MQKLLNGDELLRKILKARYHRNDIESSFYKSSQNILKMKMRKNTSFTIKEIINSSKENPSKIQNEKIREIAKKCEKFKTRRRNSVGSLPEKKIRLIKINSNLQKNSSLPEIFQKKTIYSSFYSAFSKNSKVQLTKELSQDNKTFSVGPYNSKKYSTSHLILLKTRFHFKSCDGFSISGKTFEKKPNKDSLLMSLQLNSKVLGKISVFGVFDGKGKYGQTLAKRMKNFFRKYFKTADINASTKKDNYLTIITDAFEAAKNFLKQDESLIREVRNSIISCVLLIYPQNNSKYVYCANIGESMCYGFSKFKQYPLSYGQKPESLLEKERTGGHINELNNETTKIYANEENDGNSISRPFRYSDADEIRAFSSPEINEYNLNNEEFKSFVLGSDILWKVLTPVEIGEKVQEYFKDCDAIKCSKDLAEMARKKLEWNVRERKKGFLKKHNDDINCVVVFIAWSKQTY